MSHLPLPSHPQRTDSRASVAASDTTYHSFHDLDIELYEPPSPPRNKPVSNVHQQHPSSTEMSRQDSGYESLPPRRTSTSTSQSSSRRRTSTVSSGSRPKSRPSVRKSPKASSYPPSSRASGTSLYMTRSHHHQSAVLLPSSQALQFVQFPSPDPLDPSPGSAAAAASSTQEIASEELVESPFQAPPQTTHYWTSDQTRRLEYAAIDAASRGVKGWVMRHLVPDCFVPRESRRVGFDDDSGSVRRYRLDLDDCEESPSAEKGTFETSSITSRKGWPWGGRRGSSGSASYGVY